MLVLMLHLLLNYNTYLLFMFVGEILTSSSGALHCCCLLGRCDRLLFSCKSLAVWGKPHSIEAVVYIHC